MSTDIEILRKAISRKHPCDACHNALDRLEELKSVAIAMRNWIDTVPSDAQLPTMPGFDRDWADEIINS